MEQRKKNNLSDLLMIHGAVLLFGLAGVISKGITTGSMMITFGRVFFSSITLYILCMATRTSIKLKSRADLLRLVITGTVLALHWFSFIESVRVASVAVGTITFSTFPLFVTFIEPVMFREKLRLKSVICAIVMLIGVFVLVPLDDLAGFSPAGLAWGMLSALTYALLSLMNRRFSAVYPGSVVCFYEQSAAAVVLLPFVAVMRPAVTGADIALIAVLGVLCTALAHSLFVSSLRRVKVQTAGIIAGMESVYGIILAALVLKMPPTARELIGGAIVLGVSLYTTISENREA